MAKAPWALIVKFVLKYLIQDIFHFIHIIFSRFGFPVQRTVDSTGNLTGMVIVLYIVFYYIQSVAYLIQLIFPGVVKNTAFRKVCGELKGGDFSFVFC